MSSKCEVGDQTNDCNFAKIQSLQNYAANITCDDYDKIDCHGIDLVKSLNLLKVKQRHDYISVIFECLHELAPTYLSNNFTLHSDVSEWSTRNHPQDMSRLLLVNMANSLSRTMALSCGII